MADESKQSSGDAWGDDINEDRTVELGAKLHAWDQEIAHGERKGPFDGLRLSGADVFWLAIQVLTHDPTNMSVAQATNRLRGRQSAASGGNRNAPTLHNLHLERADLHGAYLQDALLLGAHLEYAHLDKAHLERVTLEEAHLHGATLREAHLEYADLGGASLEYACLDQAHLESGLFRLAHLEHATLHATHLESAWLNDVHLEHAYLKASCLEGANLVGAHLEGADLTEARLGSKQVSVLDLERIRPWVWARPFPETLPGADLQEAFFDSATKLNDATFGDEFDAASIADVRWGGVNLAVVEWSYARQKWFRTQMVPLKLGDEREAGRDVTWIGKPKDAAARRRDYVSAVRAYRQLATELRAQGMHEDADRYAYQAQVFNRQVLRLQRRWGTVFGSWLLDRIAGYGYRPLRSVMTYLLVIFGFATAYYLLAPNVHPTLTPIDAVVFSITSFHGRGFSAGESVSLHNPLTILAAIEAIIGLVIEITFIATFTQRFFAR